MQEPKIWQHDKQTVGEYHIKHNEPKDLSGVKHLHYLYFNKEAKWEWILRSPRRRRLTREERLSVRMSPLCGTPRCRVIHIAQLTPQDAA